jgi:hypothetical protein
MNLHTYGDESLRRNDLFLLEKSDLNKKLAELQKGDDLQYSSIYGDSAYIVLDDSHIIKSRHAGGNLTDRQVLENSISSTFREAVEWHFRDLTAMWCTLDWKLSFKLLSNKHTCSSL